ncbi:MAG: nucleotide exchange factor GrpE [Gammaproteobacteria bacterium]|nr:nucleotide exchange factor GrpE [Gammaproteobacteria bacterium]
MAEPDPTPVSTDPEQLAEPDSAAQALAAAQVEIEQLKSRLDGQLRTLAELENQRKRAERDAAATARFGAERLAMDLLGVCDSLLLGLEAARAPQASAHSLAEGMELTQRQLLTVLERHGVRPIDPRGEPFDPQQHEAVSTVETAAVPANHVVEVMQKGFRLHERLLRPARVVVARPPAARNPAPAA